MLIWLQTHTTYNVFSRLCMPILLIVSSLPSWSLLLKLWEYGLGRDNTLLDNMCLLLVRPTPVMCILSIPDVISIGGNTNVPSSSSCSSGAVIAIGWVSTKCSEYLCKRIRIDSVICVQTSLNREFTISSLAQALGVTGGYRLRLCLRDAAIAFESVASSYLKVWEDRYYI